MVMLHDDAGESDTKQKALIIENFSDFEDSFCLAYTPTIGSNICINHSIFYKVYGSCTNMSNLLRAFV